MIQTSFQNDDMLEQKRQQLLLIEQKSLPVRHYLLKYILPNIAEGVAEVAKVRPRDPVEFLANYLLSQKSDKIENEIDIDLDQETVNEFQKLIESAKSEK